MLRYNYRTHRAGATRLLPVWLHLVNVLYEDSGAFKVATVLADSDNALQVEGRAIAVSCAQRSGSSRASRGAGGRNRRGFSVAMLRRGGIRVRRPRARVLRPRAFSRGGSRYSGEAALGADVLLPEGQGALSGCAAGDPACGACWHRKEETTASADFSLGRAARARRVSGRVPAAPGTSPVQARSQSRGDQSARGGLRKDRLVACEAYGALRRAALQPRLPSQPIFLRILSKGNGFPFERRDCRAPGLASRRSRCIQPG